MPIIKDEWIPPDDPADSGHAAAVPVQHSLALSTDENRRGEVADRHKDEPDFWAEVERAREHLRRRHQ